VHADAPADRRLAQQREISRADGQELRRWHPVFPVRPSFDLERPHGAADPRRGAGHGRLLHAGDALQLLFEPIAIRQPRGRILIAIGRDEHSFHLLD